ncbi:HNH endonuclease [Spirillospora sp. CA-108201]
MPENRPHIPAELERALFHEAGHRCAIPTCRQYEPLTVEHIEDWAKVEEHKFENLIVLCYNCHMRKKSKPSPRHLDRKALRQYKANLGLLNSRYGDFERRVIEVFSMNPGSRVITLTGGSDTNAIHLMRLLQDEMLAVVQAQPGDVRFVNGGVPTVEKYYLTDSGLELVEQWKTAQPIKST